MAAPSWQKFFDNHAPKYDENPFTTNTVAEVDFFLGLFPLSPGDWILDMGCGTGRHAIELARRGYRVTGVDLSEGMLKEAMRKARAADVEVEFVHADAREVALDRVFDAAICLCEGGLGLLERGEDAEAHDGRILNRVYQHLKPNAPFLMTCMNGYAAIRQMTDEHVRDGVFHPPTMVSQYTDTWELPGGNQEVQIYERLFIAPEMVRLLRGAGFVVDAVYGGTAGHWGQRPLSLDEVEAMYVCRRAP